MLQTISANIEGLITCEVTLRLKFKANEETFKRKWINFE